MTRYVRRFPEVEAEVFTAELGELRNDGKRLVVSDAARDIGITYTEGKGYAYRGHALKFGDVFVRTPGVKAVWSAKDFEAQFTEANET